MNFTLKTGFLQSNDYEQNYKSEILAMLGVFIEDAIKLSGTYSLHSGRNAITKKDIALGLKTRAFHGDYFWNSSDIQQKIQEMKQILGEDIEDIEDIEENIDKSETEVFTKSNCTCDICVTLNEIENKWNSWNPDNLMNQTIKNSIDVALS